MKYWFLGFIHVEKRTTLVAVVRRGFYRLRKDLFSEATMVPIHLLTVL